MTIYFRVVHATAQENQIESWGEFKNKFIVSKTYETSLFLKEKNYFMVI